LILIPSTQDVTKILLEHKDQKTLGTLNLLSPLKFSSSSEAAAASELEENFRGDSRFKVPKVFWPLCSKRILVTSWVDGIKINNLQDLNSGGHSIDNITKNSAEAFFLQVFRDGFFHADMHPGNVFVTSKSVIVPVDFGIMGRLNVSDRIFLARLLKSILDRDFLKVAQLHFDKGILPANASIESFAQEIRSISLPLLDKTIGQISLGKLLGELFGLASKWELTIQPQFLLLQKTMVMAEGLGRQLSPETDMWVMARPMVIEWLSSSEIKVKQFDEIISDIKFAGKRLPEILNRIDTFYETQGTLNKNRSPKTFIILSLLFVILICFAIFK